MNWSLLIFLLLFTLRSHGAIKVMTIGDSMTEEYYFEFPFSAPSSTPILGFANTKNWVEILADRRGAELDFGDYESSLLSYPDFRDAGYEYNWGIPGYDTVKWMDIIHAGLLDVEITSRVKMAQQYNEVDVIVVMVGGNDVNFQYSSLYDAVPGDAFATSFINTVVTNLGDIIDEIRDNNPSLPIVLANVPDLGSTPDIIADHPDPAKRANASAIINDLNTAIATFTTNRNLTPALISELTDKILDSAPFYIGALEMIKDSDPLEDNRPLYLFCWKGLHPSTNGQAVIANTLLGAINTAMGSNIALLPDREIITELLGLDPNQPFIDWATSNGLTDLSLTADTDGDGIPNIGEYLLGLSPLTLDEVHISQLEMISSTLSLTLTYTPNTEAERLASIVVKESQDLETWTPLPPAQIIDLGGGSYQAQMPIENDLGFLRMEFPLKP